MNTSPIIEIGNILIRRNTEHITAFVVPMLSLQTNNRTARINGSRKQNNPTLYNVEIFSRAKAFSFLVCVCIMQFNF